MSEKRAAKQARTHRYARTKRNQRVGGRVTGVVYQDATDRMVARLAKDVAKGRLTVDEALEIARLVDYAGGFAA